VKASEHFTFSELGAAELAEGIHPHPWIAREAVDLRYNLWDLAINLLEPIRDLVGAPLIIVSGYRSPERNARARARSLRRARERCRTPADVEKARSGVASRSTHMLGRAADIRCEAMSARDLHALIWRNIRVLDRLGGLGGYPRWVHVDTRPRRNGRIVTWAGGVTLLP
jgi:uncharacterized protein YcbK (DUF882 family)